MERRRLNRRRKGRGTAARGMLPRGWSSCSATPTPTSVPAWRAAAGAAPAFERCSGSWADRKATLVTRASRR